MHLSFRYTRRGAIYAVAFFMLSQFIGCVPTPDESGNNPPKISDIQTFFMPRVTNQSYLWHFFSALKDSSYFLDYAGIASGTTSEGYSPISLFKYSDTVRRDSLITEAYISDTLVEYYFGKSNNAITPRLALLHDTLRVGAKWVAAENFVTANGAPVQIQAEVKDYYGQASVGKYLYSDVFLVSYISTVKGIQIPTEPQYQHGARIDRYFARNTGDIREICKDSRDSTIWTNELVETRFH